MGGSLLAAAGLCYFGGVGAFSVSAGYVLAPFVQSLRSPSRMAGALRCSEPDTPPGSEELQLVAPPKAGALRTDSQDRRLAPVNPLKRKRRSRKIRTTTVKEEKFVPLIPGAKQTTDESILKAYLVPDELDGQQKAGEDYYVDPRQIAAEMEEKRKVEARVKKFKKKKDAYSTDKLKQEIVAPYKQNLTLGIIIAFGALAGLYAMMPQLFETVNIAGIASFPDAL
jgi:hypothetical protein